jgi:hypothetical protein
LRRQNKDVHGQRKNFPETGWLGIHGELLVTGAYFDCLTQQAGVLCCVRIYLFEPIYSGTH